MTNLELKQFIDELLTRVGSNRISSSDIRTVLKAMVDYSDANLTNGIEPWEDDESYEVDVLVVDNDRIWKSKENANLGNEPPQDTAITENDYWIEVSKSTNLSDWTPGIIGDGLFITVYNSNFYKLANPVRPYESTNIEDEIGAGDWEIMSDLQIHPPNAEEFTLGPSGFYSLTGAASNVLLPPRNGQYYKVKSKAVGDKTFILDGADLFFTWQETADPLSIMPGQYIEIFDDGTHWSTS